MKLKLSIQNIDFCNLELSCELQYTHTRVVYILHTNLELLIYNIHIIINNIFIHMVNFGKLYSTSDLKRHYHIILFLN